ncbi:bifunctional nuclease family protein [Corynebacterium simulans]|uniref:bifunctional nuclease domain-containing protein n=1 Tax=Corynebacterium simulans TaxID=146827 RepID=UPI00078BFB6D|nr:bifunctional nuclease domain-containing protein [Corynebacterium simulans]AMO90509.1 bifunctional nuclease family protein [Corynebacterium simulans]
MGSIEIVNYYEGTFMVDIVDAAGEAHDAKLSDALVVSEHFNVPITVEKELLSKVAVFVSDDDMDAYFDFHFDPPADDVGEEVAETSSSDSSASGNPQADADFEAMMRSLGVSEEDFFETEVKKESNDTRVTNDDNGDEEV